MAPFLFGKIEQFEFPRTIVHFYLKQVGNAAI